MGMFDEARKTFREIRRKKLLRLKRETKSSLKKYEKTKSN